MRSTRFASMEAVHMRLRTPSWKYQTIHFSNCIGSARGRSGERLRSEGKQVSAWWAPALLNASRVYKGLTVGCMVLANCLCLWCDKYRLWSDWTEMDERDWNVAYIFMFLFDRNKIVIKNQRAHDVKKNVVLTSMRRSDVASTSVRRHFGIKRPLGTSSAILFQ